MKKQAIKLISSILNIDKDIIKTVSEAVEDLYKIPSVHKAIHDGKNKIVGKYYDNDEVRSITDVITGEYISEQKREELLK